MIHLAEEQATYDRNRDRLVSQSHGKYVLIHKNKIDSVWDTFNDAIQAGYDRYGLKPFMVKQIGTIQSCWCDIVKWPV